MTNYHSLTPPLELIEQWVDEACPGCRLSNYDFTGESIDILATRAAQWGANQELEACCEWLDIPNNRSDRGDGWLMPDRLRRARRPKPPSLKEQGLTAMELLKQRTTDPNIIEPLSRALDALPE
ncbi:MAG: hypothetical protein EBT15_06185 [Betaproteobacteria bacterium]|nr:hypothetical protein [Betaproteobacteria bacterium]